LGIGKKVDLSKLNNNKCAEFYEIPSEFNTKKPNAPAFSFGISRNFYDKVYNESNIQVEKSYPGPGKYEIIKNFGHEAPKYSMFKRNKDRINDTSNEPGPGEYKLLSTNPLGKFPSSNIKNTTNIIFGQSREKRFTYSCKTYFYYLSIVYKYKFISFAKEEK